MSFATAFGAKLAENKDLLRIRTFDMGGHTFKVKVPLTAELEAMYKRSSEPDEALVQKYYDQLTGGFKGEIKDERIQVLEDDFIIDGRSVREAAKDKAKTEARIVEMLKLLVPEDAEFDMATLTYDMVEELFPFAIQIEMMEKIAETISPDYSKHKKK